MNHSDVKKFNPSTKIKVNTRCCDEPGSPGGECLPYNTDEGRIQFVEGGQLFRWSLIVVCQQKGRQYQGRLIDKVWANWFLR